MTARRRLAAALAIAAFATAAGAPGPSPTETKTRIAWLWDGANAPSESGIQAAVVVEQLLLTGSQARLRPRPRAPGLAAGMPVTPVVHVEISTVQPPTDLDQHRQLIVQSVLQAAALTTSGWVQLDMETRASQRDFHLAVVRDIRRALPQDLKLSITALAWWCRDTAWLDDVQADEIVPMFFRMGRDTATLRRLVSLDPQRLDPRCRQGAAGFSIQEPFDHETTDRYRKTYWFDNQHWRHNLVP